MKKLFVTLLFVSAGLFAQEKVKFTAKIANRNSDTLTIANRTFQKVIPIKKDVFSDSFEAPEGFYNMSDGTESTTIYLKPGADITLKMDAKMFDETLAYTGKGSKESNIMAFFALEQEKLEPMMEKGDEKGMMDGFAKMSEAIKSKMSDKEVSETFRTQMSAGLVNSEKQLTQMFKQKTAEAKMVGTLSPDFEYENHKGGKTKLSDLRGKYVYIDTWATWCGPCRQEIPFLQKVEERYHDKKIEFVSISVDVEKDHEKWQKFVVDHKLGGTQLFADNNWKSDWIMAYGINSIPRFILIGPDGKVVDANAARPSMPELSAQLDKLLN